MPTDDDEVAPPVDEVEAWPVDAIELIAPHVYEAYRIGKNAPKREYLPMWEEQEDRRPMLEARLAAESLERAGYLSPTAVREREAAAWDRCVRAQENAGWLKTEAADAVRAANPFKGGAS